MKNLNNYIIEKLKLDKNININISNNNSEEIFEYLKNIFKNNKAFTNNIKKIKDYISSISNSWDNAIHEDKKYIIICGDYDDYTNYIKKFKIDDSCIKFINMNRINSILSTYFNGKEDEKMTNKYTNGKHYFNMYESNFLIWIDSGLQGNDMDDVLTICIIPEYEL